MGAAVAKPGRALEQWRRGEFEQFQKAGNKLLLELQHTDPNNLSTSSGDSSLSSAWPGVSVCVSTCFASVSDVEADDCALTSTQPGQFSVGRQSCEAKERAHRQTESVNRLRLAVLIRSCLLARIEHLRASE